MLDIAAVWWSGGCDWIGICFRGGGNFNSILPGNSVLIPKGHIKGLHTWPKQWHWLIVKGTTEVVERRWRQVEELALILGLLFYSRTCWMNTEDNIIVLIT